MIPIAYAMFDGVEGKRRLPLLPTAGRGADADGPARPAWQWVGFGAVAIFVVWVPLAASSASIAARWTTGGAGSFERRAAVSAALAAAALAVAALAGGFVVGRWRGAPSAPLEAALSGFAAALAAIVGSWIALGFDPASLLAAAVAAAFAAAGGKLGRSHAGAEARSGSARR